MIKKWYSNGYGKEENIALRSSCDMKYAKVSSPTVGYHIDHMSMALEFDITMDDGLCAHLALTDPKDMEQLLQLTNTRSLDQLHGKVIEVYLQDKLVHCISVNENLL